MWRNLVTPQFQNVNLYETTIDYNRPAGVISTDVSAIDTDEYVSVYCILHVIRVWDSQVHNFLFLIDFAERVILHAFLSSADVLFKTNFFERKNQEYHQSVKQFGSRSSPILCRASSESNLFTKIISRST